MKLFLNKFSFFLLILFISFGCKRGLQDQKNSSFEINNFKDVEEVLLTEKLRAKSSIKFEHTTLASWNIRDLGKTKNAEEIKEIANTLRNFDIVALQEVVAKDPGGAQAVAKIADELNRMGSKWDYSISPPTKSPSAYMSERYAFLWKTSKVSLITKAYLDTELELKCIREPYIATFKLKKGSEPFYVINLHSKKHNDQPEDEIIYFNEYPKRLNSDRILIAGDFNLNEKHNVWKDLYKQGFKSAIQNSPTTLKKKCKNGNYLNYAIDNIYFATPKIEMLSSGSIDFVGECENLKIAQQISDHLPVYIECIIY